MYIHKLAHWPEFSWHAPTIAELLGGVRHKQGRLSGRLESVGFELREQAALLVATEEVVKSSEIEGELLDRAQVRSSVARRLGLEVAGLLPSERHVDGVVEMMLDATQRYKNDLTEERLFGWH